MWHDLHLVILLVLLMVMMLLLAGMVVLLPAPPHVVGVSVQIVLLAILRDERRYINRKFVEVLERNRGGHVSTFLFFTFLLWHDFFNTPLF